MEGLPALSNEVYQCCKAKVLSNDLPILLNEGYQYCQCQMKDTSVVKGIPVSVVKL